ncbi:dipeptidase [Janibacter melonis]|uniref:dipeptidase n=1 Tax=Janibacter melonis TaxID=262209 RepID=UPI0017826CB1|nr:dipeptidase [Janibacter melonis]
MTSPDVLSQDQIQTIRDRVRDLMPGVRADLEALTRIPSVSLDSFDQAQVQRSAEATAELLRAEGLDVEIVSEGGRPAVIGHVAGPEGSPTVLLYAHHDVQPPGALEDWDTDPFEPTERDGRLYGRGAADDKAGVMAHVAALRAHSGELPCSVRIFVEGEEEIASESLPRILSEHGDKLEADAIVLADSLNWAIGTPALTTTLRGSIRAVVTVRTLDHGVHSGMFGGACPDALTTLARLLATLHDDQGDVAIEGLKATDAPELDYDEARLREESGLLPGTELIGTGSILSRLWTKPAAVVIGIDAPAVDEAGNVLNASARAKINLRLHPQEDPQDAWAALQRHLADYAPWGATVEVELDEQGWGFAADAQGPVYDQARAAFADAWGTDPVDVGIGGSIPFVQAFAERFPDAAILVTGVEDPDTRAHGANESLHLGEFERTCAAEALLLARLGAMPRG